MHDLTHAFVEYLFLKRAAISESILLKAEACRRDYYAVAGAGAKKNRARWEKLLRMSDAGSSTLVGYPEKADRRTAALINGFNAHTLELDDGQRFAMIHLGAAVLPAIDAAAEGGAAAERDILTGVVMGYEAACRTAIAMQPYHKNRGFHAAGTCGTIGAAVGAAIAMGMDRTQMKRVLTCAAGSAAGMLEMQEQRSELKPYNVGRAAMDGLTAALMGFADFETPDDMLGGERGFFTTYSDKFDAQKLTEQTAYFEIERIYVKPYASCRHSHSAVEAAIELSRDLDCGKIESVKVETYRLAVKGHDHSELQGTASAKLSMPYAVAAALLYGRADLTLFEPVDEKAAALAKKITVVENRELTDASPQKRAAIVTVKLRDGTALTRRVDYAKGDPENPMTDGEFAEKIRILESYSPVE